MRSVRPLIQQAVIYKYNINHIYVGPFILVTHNSAKYWSLGHKKFPQCAFRNKETRYHLILVFIGSHNNFFHLIWQIKDTIQGGKRNVFSFFLLWPPTSFFLRLFFRLSEFLWIRTDVFCCHIIRRGCKKSIISF